MLFNQTIACNLGAILCRGLFGADCRWLTADIRNAEWHFRSSLDRYVWIHGMICAYMKPWAEGILVRIDAMAFRGRLAMRSLLLAGERSARSPA